jgi:riboflavin biosynthesis pyrimidine reductase
VEAGPTLLTALWRERVIDELVTVVAGGMGGTAAPPLYLGPPDGTAEALQPPMRAVEAGVLGRDAVTVWRYASANED